MNQARQQDKTSRMIAAFVAVMFALTLAGAAIPAQAQTFKSLDSFVYNTDGLSPSGQLVQATDGILYGTTQGNEIQSDGTVFTVTSGGTLTTLYNFSGGAAGLLPYAGLVLASNGNLYGTTEGAGTNADGTAYSVSPSGTVKTVHEFDGTDGSAPVAVLIQGTNGQLYGTTQEDGAYGYGTVFSMTTGGTVTTLHSFTGGLDGANPFAGLVEGTDGNFYGTTVSGGGYGYGVVFKMTPAGTVTTLYSFLGDDPNGMYPHAGLVQGANGAFYGTATYAGKGAGTVFKITSGGTLTLLYSFCSQTNCADGGLPYAGLTQGTDGNFYGATTYGGANGQGGTLFKITPGGAYTTLYSFCAESGCTDGADPEGTLVQDTNGTFYGTTFAGGNRWGTIFSLDMGFQPFVSMVRSSGEVGAKVEILGQKLKGTTGVSFNGTAASFTIVSNTYLTAIVPAGATTGTVQVTTSSGTLNSNQAFRVTPQIKSFTPTSGPVGTPVQITGVSLKQTTKVTFGGVKATNFTANSDTQVTANVPTGAKTGRIAITTPGGTATSSGIFTVTQ